MANQKTKICPVFNKNRPLSGFYSDKNRPDGKVTVCTDCKKSGKALYRKNGGSLKTKPVPADISNASVSLDFLADYKRPTKMGWQLPQVKQFLLKFEEAIKAGVTNFDKVYAAYGAGRSKSGCVNLINELRKLALHNRKQKETGGSELSLDDYWRGKREFKFGNQIVAEAKPKGKR